MAPRRKFTAIVTADNNNTIVEERTKYAWNSAVRASEDIVRQYSRKNVIISEGMNSVCLGKPGEPGSIYRRVWVTPAGRELVALVYEKGS